MLAEAHPTLGRVPALQGFEHQPVVDLACAIGSVLLDTGDVLRLALVEPEVTLGVRQDPVAGPDEFARHQTEATQVYLALHAFTPLLAKLRPLAGERPDPPSVEALRCLCTELPRETVWKIAEGVSIAYLRRLKIAKWGFFTLFCPLVEPLTRRYLDLPNSLRVYVLGSSHAASCCSMSRSSSL